MMRPLSFLDTFRRLYGYIRPYRRQFLLGITAVLAVDLLSVFPPLVLKRFVDQIQQIAAGDTRLGPFLWLGLVYALIALGQGISRYFWRMLLLRASFEAAQRVREEYFSKLQRLPPAFYDRNAIGDLISLATNDVEAVRFTLGPGILVFADAVFYAMIIPPAMIWLSPKLALIALAPMAVIPFVMVRLEKMIHDRFARVQAEFSRLTAFSQENIAGIRLVKAFVREWAQLKRFKNIGREFVRLNVKLARAQVFFEPFFTLIVSLGIVLLIILAGPDVIRGTVSIGTFVAFTRYLEHLVWPMMALGLALTYYQRGKTSLERIVQVLDQKEVPEDRIEALPASAPDGFERENEPPLVEARDLTFTYPGSGVPALRNVSFRVESGKRTAVVGTVASGKSTVVRLLAGLYEPGPGMLFWKGTDVARMGLWARRVHLAVVPQDVFLFMETLRWNVALGGQGASLETTSDDQILRALHAAGMREEAERWGLDVQLGERGLNLSGGQRGRVALARAILRSAPLIVMDDALSSVDSDTELKILSRLTGGGFEKHGLLMVTHRLSHLWRFDHVIVLKDGAVAESGDPKILAESGGLYQQLLEMQRLEDELAG